jgi:hypothetical protein
MNPIIITDCETISPQKKLNDYIKNFKCMCLNMVSDDVCTGVNLLSGYLIHFFKSLYKTYKMFYKFSLCIHVCDIILHCAHVNNILTFIMTERNKRQHN